MDERFRVDPAMLRDLAREHRRFGEETYGSTRRARDRMDRELERMLHRYAGYPRAIWKIQGLREKLWEWEQQARQVEEHYEWMAEQLDRAAETYERQQYFERELIRQLEESLERLYGWGQPKGRWKEAVMSLRLEEVEEGVEIVRTWTAGMAEGVRAAWEAWRSGLAWWGKKATAVVEAIGEQVAAEAEASLKAVEEELKRTAAYVGSEEGQRELRQVLVKGLDVVQTALDVVGLVPVVGEAADAVNAAVPVKLNEALQQGKVPSAEDLRKAGWILPSPGVVIGWMAVSPWIEWWMVRRALLIGAGRIIGTQVLGYDPWRHDRPWSLCEAGEESGRLEAGSKQTVPVEEAAAIAEHVYYDPRDFEKIKAETEKHPLPGGWKLVEQYRPKDDRWSGLKIGVYAKQKPDGTMAYVLANEGTNELVDWVNNVQQPLGKSKDMWKSIAYARRFVNRNPHAEITFVGHSKGGAEAVANAVRTGKNAIVFNTAVAFLKKYNLDFAAHQGEIAEYTVTGDLLNRVEGWLPQPVDRLVCLPAQYPAHTGISFVDVWNGVGNHRMEAVRKALEEQRKKEANREEEAKEEDGS